MTRLSLAAGLVLSVVTVWLGVVVGASPAGADPIADCSTTVGEIVVVDFSHWGGPVDRGCDATLTTGYNAMYQAGFITQGTAEDGQGFICRIGLASEGSSSYEPTPAEDPCVNTPPATAYWSYWHADVGQNTWAYSPRGPMDYEPPPGSVDAWVFGATNISGTSGGPSFPPSAVRATNTTPTPTSSTTSSTPSAPTSTTSSLPAKPPPTSAPGTSPHHGGGAAPPKNPASSQTTEPPTPATTVVRTAGGKSEKSGGESPPAASTTTPQKSATPRIVTIGSPLGAPAQSSNGSPALFAVGAGAVVVLATAGTLVAWRRRHSGAS
jgi:hypothetical protein